MKVELTLECAECYRCQILEYIDEKMTKVNNVVLQFVLAEFNAEGWTLGEEPLCPVCNGKMSEEEYERKYCQPDQDFKIDVTSGYQPSPVPKLKLIK